ncbi:hypothetical protein NBRC110019_13370 [Neptunitalea chrysea]|uniref:DUF4199 domain-containing protein n=1 Tax=Neptunitalea chrysea TaxID=1647581 RepID=A0A9W6EW20_9FLAO|nr:DUF4199 domain-containing protein [Neptunitalea chrysea]GLB52298.1 hypothetical protein NBRC110019_13370 [Neptunitalea chrysea]
MESKPIMESKPNSIEIMLSNGIVIGLITVVASVVLYTIGEIKTLGWVANILWFIAMITFIILGILKFKKKNEGYLSLGDALKIGVGAAAIAAVISSIYQVLFMLVIDPALYQQLIDDQVLKTMNGNPSMTKEQIKTTRSAIEFMSSPLMIAAMGILWYCFMGFIISLISGLAMKKTEDSF